MPKIAASGAFSDSVGTALASLTVVAPAIGNLRVLAVGLGSSSITVNSVSGGGVGSWAKATAITANAFRAELWWGQITSTGNTTVTPTYSGSVSSVDVELLSQMFSSNLTTPKWLADTSATNTSSATTLTFPTLTPALGTELYVGYCIVANTGSAGSTTGYTYNVTTANVDVFCYNSTVTASTSPTAAQSPTGWFDAVGALFAVRDAAEFFMTGV